MAKLRAHNISVSADGFMAGPDQSVDAPLGVGAQRLHTWVFETERGRRMIGQKGGTEGVDNAFLLRADENIGATVMGRNMFGPVRGGWPDESWRGWWGEEPPFHHPVFVLTHHPRPSLEMKGTVFHFVTDGLDAALDRAFEAADGADVRVGGGASTLQQCMRNGRLDLLHVALVPVLLGGGERLFDNLGTGTADGYECVEFVSSPSVAHLLFERTGAEDAN
ncbi:dihydrofolate reductase family protein [Streptacidiphilus fuscans]|uniref:Dihydrofolate reductase n=1 Tax=Streptacidiphilus fuscans TaxID=2789292 RepID=A0A931B4A9_9ACTN|nr:dihydrofolate reductase family protein [Streptacidiphilus fuscans]MBF9068701.1 dihydrofolate reductase [Streptacidiphilus fuscans]